MDMCEVYAVRLEFNKKNNKFYMPVKVHFEPQEIEEDTCAHVEKSKKIFTHDVVEEFRFDVSINESNIIYEELSCCLADILCTNDFLDEPYMRIISYNKTPKVMRGNILNAIQSLDGKLSDGMFGNSDEFDPVLEKYDDTIHILGYYPALKDKSRLKVEIPSLFAKNGNRLYAKSKIIVPVDIYSIELINKEDFK
jgi:hypothetical protein